jgi:adenylosuccinate synthase
MVASDLTDPHAHNTKQKRPAAEATPLASAATLSLMKKAYIVVDLGYGDQGKGTTVDWLVRHHGAGTVVRFNGGAQAAHHVVLPDGRWHKFSQFGSGMFVDDTTTFLSKHVLVAPRAMMKEAAHLETLGVQMALARTWIDAEAPIISPFQQATNRIIELQRGCKAHGSCGIGIGETMEDLLTVPQLVIRAGDLFYPDIVRQKLRLLKEHKRVKLDRLLSGRVDSMHPDAAAEFNDCFIEDGVIDFFLKCYSDFVQQVHIVSKSSVSQLLDQDRPLVFEGAQGVLLDEWHGFHPHTTWSTTTFENAIDVLDDIGFTGEIRRIGVTRAYSTRHGAGPFVTYDEDMTRRLPEPHNAHNRWQGGMRSGWLDLVALKYACNVAGPMDYLSVTCLDRVQPLGELRVCSGYKLPDGSPMRLEVTSSRDLVAREKVTQALEFARPIFEDVSTVDGLLTKIQSTVGIAPHLLSFGPTADDKDVVHSAVH